MTIIYGTANADSIDGTTVADQIFGRGGDDVIFAHEGDDELRGEAGADYLIGGLGNDTIYGGIGNDESWGAEGNDVIRGEAGDDILRGNEGDDDIEGADGADLIEGDGFGTGGFGDGADLLSGGAGNDTIRGGGGNDVISGGADFDQIDGGDGEDQIDGGDGDDFLNGSAGSNPSESYADILRGGLGNDRLIGGYGDTLDGGDGTDAAFVNLYAATAGITADLTDLAGGGTLMLGTGSVTGVEHVGYLWMTAYDDTVVGGTVAGVEGIDINGLGGNDDLTGSSGIDLISGGDGDDVIRGGIGFDAALSPSKDRISGENGNDILHIDADGAVAHGGSGDDVIYGGAAMDGIYGDNDTDQLYGGGGDDHIYGGSGDDLLVGGEGNDRLQGEDGNDIYIIDSPGDQAAEGVSSSGGIDEVRASVSFTLSTDIEILTLTGVEAIDGRGNYQANTLTGNDADNILNGGEGNDLLQGGGGDDELYGEGGDDTLEGGEGNDYLDGGTGANLMIGGLGDDVYEVHDSGDSFREATGEGNDTVRTSFWSYSLEYLLGIDNLVGTATYAQSLTGNRLDNVITGGSGSDTITGLDGNDTLSGGAGDDLIYGGLGIDTMSGGLGMDTYVVEQVGDLVIEEADGGLDRTDSALATYTLTANVEMLIGRLGTGQELIGNELNNRIVGREGNDRIDGGLGIDTMLGGLGNDVFIVDNAGDVVTENAGEGTDEVRTGLGTYVLHANVERLIGTGSAAQSLTGNALGNHIDGGAGADTMAGGLGDDVYIVSQSGDRVTEAAGEGVDEVRTALAAYTLAAHVDNLTGTGSGGQTLTGNGLGNRIDGGLGADAMAGGGGHDVYVVDNAGDTVSEAASSGIDTVETGLASYTLGANVENVVGTGAAAQTFTGNALNNRLDGGAGADTLSGGLGNDVYVVDDAADKLVETAGQGIDEVQSAVTFSLGQALERLTLTGTAAIDGTGNDLDNILAGNEAANRLAGRGGKDSIFGHGGDDILDGGLGADTMTGAAGDDIYYFDQSGDRAVEAADGGIDTVRSAVTVALGPNLENLVLTGTASLAGTGNALVNSITGNAGHNRLDGRAGADTLRGLAGNDTYIVDDAGDLILENSGQGYDSARSSVSYAIGAHVEKLVLTGTASIDGTGNDLVNVLTGNAGDNRLDGGAGADTMQGFSGDDLFIVDNAADRAIERAGGGTDTVEASVAFRLAGHVENLTLTGSAAINGVGNELANVLTGNDAANQLNGLGGADTLRGMGGDDTYVVDDALDLVVEGAGAGYDTVLASSSYTLADHVEALRLLGTDAIDATGNAAANALTGNGAANLLSGEAGDDLLSGAGGDDALHGGLGADELRGGAGADSFRFDTALGDGNVDWLADFAVADDTIMLDAAVFTGFGMDGTIDAGQFHAGTAAQDADDLILYDAATGNIFYDQDGSGEGAALLFATVRPGLALTHADFVIYNAPPAGEVAATEWLGF